MKTRFFRAAALALSLSLACVLAPKAHAAGLSVFIASNINSQDFPHVRWRLAATFTQGLADFLYEVRVMQKLIKENPEEAKKRLPKDYAQIKLETPHDYVARFFWHVENAVAAEARFLEARQKEAGGGQAVIVEAFMVPASIPRVMPQQNPGDTIELGKLISLIISDEMLAQIGQPAVRQALDALRNINIHILDGGMSDLQWQDIVSAMRQRTETWRGRSQGDDLLSKISVHMARMTVAVQNGKVNVDFAVSGETRAGDVKLPPKDLERAGETFGLVASPTYLRLDEQGGFEVSAHSDIRRDDRERRVFIKFGKFDVTRGARYQNYMSLINPDSERAQILVKFTDRQGNETKLAKVANALRPYVDFKALCVDASYNYFRADCSDLAVKILGGWVNAGQERALINELNDTKQQKTQEVMNRLASSVPMQVLSRIAPSLLVLGN